QSTERHPPDLHHD
ncbi:hypothetical protein D047_0614B, partial [Vibrio parahaemolyticus VPTS-2010_2]